jgi:hypothetical protein
MRKRENAFPVFMSGSSGYLGDAFEREEGQRMLTLEEKMEGMTRMELMEHAFASLAETVIIYSKILLEHLGKEKAIDLVKKARWDARYGRGRETAESLENPKDLSAFLEAYFVKAMDRLPFVPQAEIREHTKDRVVVGVSKCFLAEAIQKHNLSEDLLDVVKAYCNHDEGWAAGWNPDMKFKKVKFLLNGDDRCDFLCEVKQ